MDNSKLASKLYDRMKRGATVLEIEFMLDDELPTIAAQILGAKGGSVTSDAKTEANRKKCNLPPRPGSRSRGKPKGSKNKPKQESMK